MLCNRGGRHRCNDFAEVHLPSRCEDWRECEDPQPEECMQAHCKKKKYPLLDTAVVTANLCDVQFDVSMQQASTW